METQWFVSNSIKCNDLRIKLTYLVAVMYKICLLFTSVSTHFEAFSAS